MPIPLIPSLPFLPRPAVPGRVLPVQAHGRWREYGATETALRIGVGLIPPHAEPLHAIDTKGNTLWHYWAEGPHPEQGWTRWMETLDECDIDHLNDRGEHPLHRLAIRGHAQAIREWSRHWGRAHALRKVVPTHDGDTVLHRAAWSGNPATIAAVLASKPSLDVQDKDGYTALTIALHRGGWAALEPLLKAKADPNVRDLRGRTVMHHAAEHRDISLMDQLERFGGDRDWEDDIGRTADDLLMQRLEADARRASFSGRHWGRLFEERLCF